LFPPKRAKRLVACDYEAQELDEIRNFNNRSLAFFDFPHIIYDIGCQRNKILSVYTEMNVLIYGRRCASKESKRSRKGEHPARLLIIGLPHPKRYACKCR
jgi:hypothetical protein